MIPRMGIVEIIYLVLTGFGVSFGVVSGVFVGAKVSWVVCNFDTGKFIKNITANIVAGIRPNSNSLPRKL